MKSLNHLNISLYLVALSIFFFTGCTTTQRIETQDTAAKTERISPQENWQDQLKSSFRKNYGTAVQHHSSFLHQNYPVIVQDLLNMTLIRSNGEKVRFQMKKDAYSTLAHTSHTPLTIYSILMSSGFKVDNDSTLKKLSDYSEILQDAKIGVTRISHLNDTQKERIVNLFEISKEYIQKTILDKMTTKDKFHKYAESVRAFVHQNLSDGANEQLVQFLDKMNEWKIIYPEEDWKELRVVILGFHQARERYALKLFFQWLLDEPTFEKKVVFAEYQFSIFGKNRSKAEELALELLTKVNLDKEVSYFLLGEETLLQQDVMGPAAEQILKSWGESEWFNN